MRAECGLESLVKTKLVSREYDDQFGNAVWRAPNHEVGLMSLGGSLCVPWLELYFIWMVVGLGVCF